MIDTDKYEGHTPASWRWADSSTLEGENTVCELSQGISEADAQLIADAPLLLQEVKRFRKMCLNEMVCYDCLSDLYKAGLSDENPVDAYWCGMCSEPMKGVVE